MVERPVATDARAEQTVGRLIEQVLERPLLPGEDSLDDLERAFRATPVDPPQPSIEACARSPPRRPESRQAPAASRSASPSIRSNS